MLQQNSANLSQSLARLSSGSKLTSPADDSAGLAVSMKMTAQISRTGAAQDNVNNAISFNQTQDGYLQQVNTALTRMSELAVSAQDVTKTSADLKLYNQEYQALGSFITNVAGKTFNGVSLFSGTTLNVTTDSEGVAYTAGGNAVKNSGFSNTGVQLLSAGSTTTSYSTAIGDNLTSATFASTALTDTESAINQLASDRANIGANEESLGYYSGALSTLTNNLQAANSGITDVDVATESTNYAKENILVQSATAMLAQANSMPQSVLRLLS
jgi:flagellin